MQGQHAQVGRRTEASASRLSELRRPLEASYAGRLIAVSAKALAGRLANAHSGYGMLAMRAIEVGAALIIVAFGALLLSGYIASERMIGV